MPNDRVALTKLILLIDGENLDSKYARTILRKAAELGTMTEGRVYGKADNGRMAGWKKSRDAVGLKMIDVPNTSKKKNISDFRLIVDAMSLVHTRKLDVLCIGSSDGDFSALVTNVRERSVSVYGFGEKKAPAAYKNLLHEFFDCAKLEASKVEPKSKISNKSVQAPRKRSSPPHVPAAQEASEAKQTPPHPNPPPKKSSQVPRHVVDAVLKSVRSHEGRASFRDVGNELHTLLPKFKPQTYQFGTTKALLKSLHGKHGVEITDDGYVILAMI